MLNNIPIDMDKRGALDIGEETSKVVEDNIKRREEASNDLNKFIYIFGVFGFVLAIFQIWRSSSLLTGAVSFTTWALYLIVAGMWLGYGIYYRNKAITVVYSLWAVLEVIVLLGYFY